MDNSTFLPPELYDVLKNIIHRVCGALLFLFGVVLILGLFCYSNNQDAFNIATTGEAKPFIGNFFNYISDYLIGFFGFLSSLFIGSVFVRYGYQIMLAKISGTNSNIRFLSILLGGVFCSVSLSMIFLNTSVGGLIGGSISNNLSLYLPAFLRILIGFLLIGLTSYFVIIALDFTYSQVWNFLQFISKNLVIFAKNIKNRIKNEDLIEYEPIIKEETEIKESEKSEKKSTPVKKTEKVQVKTPPKKSTGFLLPPLNLLIHSPNQKNSISKIHRQTASLLETCLAEFGVQGNVKNINPGPVVTLYEFEPAPGITINSIIARTDDIARSMEATSIRIATIPGSKMIGIEVPNLDRQTVHFQGLVADSLFQNSKYSIPLVLGQDIGGENVFVDLSKMPHLLVAGRTGAGKSVFMLDIIMSVLYKFTPDECKLILIDPKKVEFSNWKNIPHLLTPVVTDAEKAVNTLKWAVREMELRYDKLGKIGVNNLKDYNKKAEEMRNKGEVKNERVKVGVDPETGQIEYEERPIDLSNMPLLVIVIDEVAELMALAKKEVEICVQRLTQLARAAGIHLVMATQRPSVDVITGIIKSNLPTRISFQTVSAIDSKTILGITGAENLLDKGDMLYISSEFRSPVRIQAPFITNEEAHAVAEWLRAQGSPDYKMSVVDATPEPGTENSSLDRILNGGKPNREDKDEELYQDAVKAVIEKNQPSISYIQRCLHIGYNKAATFIERMEQDGIISEPGHAGKRTVLKK